jgi:type II secretory pathway pseudopilin PulG
VVSARVRCRPGAAGQRGFTYLAVLIAVALLGIGLAAQSEAWVASAQRARSAQADWAGAEYARAIASYLEQSPNGAKAFPRRLDDLVEDRRGPTVRRHLRQLYPNPLAGDGRWRLLRGADGGIVGVGVQRADGAARDYVQPSPRLP